MFMEGTEKNLPCTEEKTKAKKVLRLIFLLQIPDGV